jgi:hypothetical protein
MTSPSNRPTATGTTTTEGETTEARAPALDLSLTKIIGGALAAVTTAVAVSFLGVTGTVTGAAFGSVVSSIAAALYAASFQTAGTRIRARGTIVRGRPEARDPDPDTDTGEPDPRGTGPVESTTPVTEPRRAMRRVPWKPAALLAGIVFVVALGFISATETFLGHQISDSSAAGTSVGAVVRGRAPAPVRSSEPSSPSRPLRSVSNPSPSPSPSESDVNSSSTGSPSSTSDESISRRVDQGPTARPTDTYQGQGPTAPGSPTNPPVGEGGDETDVAPGLVATQPVPGGSSGG